MGVVMVGIGPVNLEDGVGQLVRCTRISSSRIRCRPNLTMVLIKYCTRLVAVGFYYKLLVVTSNL